MLRDIGRQSLNVLSGNKIGLEGVKAITDAAQGRIKLNLEGYSFSHLMSAFHPSPIHK
jgi:hypothetical protein